MGPCSSLDPPLEECSAHFGVGALERCDGVDCAVGHDELRGDNGKGSRSRTPAGSRLALGHTREVPLGSQVLCVRAVLSPEHLGAIWSFATLSEEGGLLEGPPSLCRIDQAMSPTVFEVHLAAAPPEVVFLFFIASAYPGRVLAEGSMCSMTLEVQRAGVVGSFAGMPPTDMGSFARRGVGGGNAFIALAVFRVYGSDGPRLDRWRVEGVGRPCHAFPDAHVNAGVLHNSLRKHLSSLCQELTVSAQAGARGMNTDPFGQYDGGDQAAHVRVRGLSAIGSAEKGRDYASLLRRQDVAMRGRQYPGQHAALTEVAMRGHHVQY